MNTIVDKRMPPWRLVTVLMAAAMTLSGCSGRDDQASIEQLVAEMNQRIEAIIQAEKKEGVVPRFNQPKTVACVTGRFRVHGNLPETLRQGIFSQPADYPVMLRFANATNRDDSQKDIRGLSLKVYGVQGSALWGDPGTQDFLFNSYPALFVATPEDFLAFIRARQEDKKLAFFFNPFDSHLKSLWIGFKAREKHLSPLDIRYWSTVPFRLGETGNQVVKYSLSPCSTYVTTDVVNAGENQLRYAIKAHLRQGPACFDFAVQPRTNPEIMPIEDASVIWDEKASPFQTVATIIIENQEFDGPQALATCERSSFNPWQSLAAHEPLGRMNEVRRLVYAHAVKVRNKE